MNYLHIVVAVLAAFILISCACRGDHIRMSEHKIGWGVMYLVYAAYGGGELLQVVDEQPIAWFEVAGLLAVACNLWLTKHLWREDVPASVMK